jgi:chitobiase/beta-hexosaminidase-like protein
VIKNYPDCGLYEEGAGPCGKPVIASDDKTITLSSSTPGAWFRYTLDGTTPTRTRGHVYCGAISVQPSITLKAIAYKSGMADSAGSEWAKRNDRDSISVCALASPGACHALWRH